VMKLAVAYRRKSLAFISSVGVVSGLDHPQPIKETEIGSLLATEHPGDGAYAMGYSASKWATEVQLQQLSERYGVPVAVFRCALIMAHSSALGQINPTDMFTRLLASLVYTGIAPKSFYQDPNAPDLSYNGLPIDFVSAGIAGIACSQRSGLGLYHMVNPHHDDGVSLDTIVRWVQSAGYPLRFIDDYDQWYQEFRAALEKVDARLRANTSLPTVYQWERPQTGDEMRFESEQTRAKIRETTHHQDVPHLTEDFIHMNLRHMVALHIIPPPPGRAEE
jgi:fatty acid CoA ligase FadD9